MGRGRSILFQRTTMWLGIVLCASLAALWIATRWWALSIDIVRGTKTDHIVANRGLVWAYRFNLGNKEDAAKLWPSDITFEAQRNQPPLPYFWWFRWGNDHTVRASPYAAPLWFPVVLIAIPTAYLWRRTRRVAPGLCPKCKYNLAGLASQAPCPECGFTSTVPSPQPVP
jgi:hypothetical protein